MEDIYFYHSFGLGKDNDHGLKVLNLIFRHGILLTVEPQRFLATRSLSENTFVQKRACFTAIPARELAAFAKGFGPFVLEFDGQALREFGVLPVAYTAGWMPGGALLDSAGSLLGRQWLESYYVMAELVHLVKNGNAQEKAVAEKIWNAAGRATLAPEELQFSLEALMNLCYPSDEFGTGEFGYFKEREWRIVPNLALAGGSWLYPAPNADQTKELRELDADFFEKIIRGKPQVEQCAFLRDIGGHNVVERARRIIVPPEAIGKAKELAAVHKYDPDRVVLGNLPEFSG
jgi:hypothetical protein